MNPAPRLEAKGLRFAYQGGAAVLDGLDLSLEPGDFLALVGPNGSGKTTLAMQLAGLLQPNGGTIAIGGADLAQLSVAERARRLGCVFQNPDHQLFGATVEQELSLGPRNLELPQEEVAARVGQAAEQFGLADLLNRRVGTLSYGQRKSLSLAAVAAMQPQIWILDEPTTGLHWQAAQSLLDWLQERGREGHSVMLITHDLRLVAEYASRAVLLRAGRIAAAGKPYELFGQIELLQQAAFEPPQIVQLAQQLRMPPDLVTVEAACRAFWVRRG